MDNTTMVTGTTPEKLTENILKGVEEQLKTLAKQYQPKEPEDFLTRKETAALLKISLVCLHDWCNKGILKFYKIGNRTYFSRKEINETMFNSNK
jgi:hypothetical protein